MELEQEKLLDVDKVFKDKNPKVYKWLPKFFLSFIKRTIHQDEMNEVVATTGHLQGVDFANHLIKNVFNFQLETSHVENVPKTGPIIVVSNHPLGGLDGIALLYAVGEQRPDVRFLVNDILSRIPNFNEVFIPVNKLGANAKRTLIQIERIFASDVAVLIFPAGLCSRRGKDGIIKDLAWTKSFITKARKYNHPIIPVHISGKNSNWFYWLSNFRKKIGFESNLEMFYLPDEMFKQKGKKVKISFGKLIQPSQFSQIEDDQEVASAFREFIYTLESNPNADFDGFLKSFH